MPRSVVLGAVLAGVCRAALVAAPRDAAAVAPPLSRDVDGDGVADLVLDGPRLSARHRSAAVALGRAGLAGVGLGQLGAGGFLVDVGPHELIGVDHVGDVDGDGRADLVARVRRGAQVAPYLVYGKRDAATVRLFDLGRQGRRLPAATVESLPKGLGDVNGDRLDDLLVEKGARTLRVVHGRQGRRRLGRDTPGFDIRLRRRNSPGGRKRSEDDPNAVTDAGPAGDADGDGRADVLVLLEEFGYCGEGPGCGARGYVVFGGAGRGGATISGTLAGGFGISRPTRGAAGYEIQGYRGGEGAGPVGDFDGDRRDDVVAAAGYGARRQRPELVFGKPDGRSVRADPPAGRGALLFRHGLGEEGTVAGLGDVSGDRLGDALYVEERGRSVIVAFGRHGRGVVDHRVAGFAGLRIDLPADTTVYEARATGDVNGDGLGDLLPGAASGQADAVTRHVVFGRRAPGTLTLDQPGTGFAVR